MAKNVTSEFVLTFSKSGRVRRFVLDDLKSIHGQRCWIHLDEDNQKSIDWLKNDSGLDDIVIENLMDEETHPRLFSNSKGIFVLLRDVNKNRNAEVEDMISIRLWIEEKRIISLSHRRQNSVENIVENFIKNGHASQTMLGIFIHLAKAITENIEKVLEKIDDELDDFEDEVIDVDRFHINRLRSRISDIRHQILGMRRYIAPQRDLFINLKVMEKLNNGEKAILRSIRRDMNLAVNELEYAREHSSVSQEELDSRSNVQLNQTMYLLTIIMVVLSPLTLITGILGSNSLEIMENPLGFVYITIALFLLAFIQIWYFKNKRLF